MGRWHRKACARAKTALQDQGAGDALRPAGQVESACSATASSAARVAPALACTATLAIADGFAV